jgi:hypothetical protein
MSSNFRLEIILRMTAFCMIAGIVSGGLFGFVLICPIMVSMSTFAQSGSAAFVGVGIGMVGGGTFALVFGLISGGLIARATGRDELCLEDAGSYTRSMQTLSRTVALAGVLVVCVLLAALIIPTSGWQSWFSGVLIFVLVPGSIALFAFSWASKRVADWAVQTYTKSERVP